MRDATQRMKHGLQQCRTLISGSEPEEIGGSRPLAHLVVCRLDPCACCRSGRPAPDGSPDSLEHHQSQYLQSKYFVPMVLVPTPPTSKQPEPAPPNGDGHGHPPRAPGARAASAPPILHDKKLLCQVCQKVALGIRWLTCKVCKTSDLKPPKLERLCSGHRRSNAFVGCEYARCLAYIAVGSYP